MSAQGDFLNSPQRECRAVIANLAQMFPLRIPLSDYEKFFSTFTRLCPNHGGCPLPGLPQFVQDGEVAKRFHAAWFGNGGPDDVVLVAAVALDGGSWDLFSTLEGTWPLEMRNMLKPITDAMRQLQEEHVMAGKREFSLC